MADLEEMGLLHSPHTSAGRVPTVRGYRLFVDTLLRVNQLDIAAVERIAEELGMASDTRSLLQRTSNMLSDITHLVSIVMLPRLEQNSLKHIEFVSLSKNKILVIMVINNGDIQNRIIHTAKVYTPGELQEASNYLNNRFVGKDLDRIKEDILKELRGVKEDVNQIMQRAIEMAQQAIMNPDKTDDFFLAGQTNLMDVEELCDVNCLRNLFNSFNQKRDILHLLEQSINARGVQIFIGEEAGYDVLDNCSVVTSPYEANGQIMGVLGVIGPTRMQYDRVIPIVDITAKMLGSALNSDN